MKTLATGTCLCGAVTLNFDLDKNTFDVCHCGMCRKWSGGPAFSIDAAAPPRFVGLEFISTYASSAWAERGFCRVCGTHLFYKLTATGFYNVPVGLIDGHERFQFVQQIYIDRKPAHYTFANQTKTLTEAEVVKIFG